MAGEVMDALFGGLKRVGEAGMDIGKAVASIPLNVATAIPDFLKDPEVFLAGGRENAVAALLSSDFRKQRKADLTAARDFDKMVQTKQTMDWLEDLFSGRDQNSRHGAAIQAEQAGVPSEQIDTALGLANQQDQRSAIARQGVRTALPSIPSELVDAANFTPEQAIGKIIAAQSADAIQGRSDAASARAARRLTLSERREQRLAQEATRNPPKTEDEKFQRRLREKSATRVYDKTADAIDTAAPDLIGTISDPGMAGSLRSQLPEFSVKEAERAAKKAIDEALPPNSRRNLAARKAAKKALREKAKSLPQNTGLDSPVLDDSPLPTDQAQRLSLAASLGEQLLAAGFPPDKAAEELLRRGFSAEELPE